MTSTKPILSAEAFTRGRCWTWYASIGGSTRPIPLSKGAGVWCISSHATIPYHWVGLLCARKMPLGNAVDHHPRGAGCEMELWCPAQLPGVPHILATDGLIGINSTSSRDPGASRKYPGEQCGPTRHGKRHPGTA